MSPNSKRKSIPSQDSFSPENFLSSINLQFDADSPERIEHFHPTSKSINLLKAILGHEKERSFFIVAPYGSGKSLTATYALHLIENRDTSSEMLSLIGKRLAHVGNEIGALALKRLRSKKRGLVIALDGYCPNFPESFKASILQGLGRLKLGRQARSLEALPCTNIDEVILFLRKLRDVAIQAKLDQISILWDEFGRNIEKLLSEGKSSKLNDVQVLAEFVSRSKTFPITLGLLMHQNLLNYASNVPQSVRTEWAKVEGRFKTLQYVDNSKEIYRLISEVISHQKSSLGLSTGKPKVDCKEIKQHKLFKEFTQKELEDLFQKVYPLTPLALYLLPKISARVAQNERTLFSFLYSIKLYSPIYPDEIYDYFSSDMRVDTTAGGTYKQWLETQSALSKIEDNPTLIKILKTTCLLGLGMSGERARASKNLLLTALAGLCETQKLKESIKSLIDRKLLLFRRHNDEVSIWHGTDIDLRGKLIEEKSRTRDEFDLASFLTQEIPPPIWYPVEYNNNFNTRRYFTGEYRCLPVEDILKDLPYDQDGKIIYLIVENKAQIEEAKFIAEQNKTLSRLVFAIPRDPIPIFDAAHEIWSLHNLQKDSSLLDTDPLVTQEIQQMTDDAWAHLERLLDRTVKPSQNGPIWYNQGQKWSLDNPAHLRKSLSKLMREVFSDTPKINNESIIRKKPTAVMVNARKKLLMAILEKSGQEDLGLEGFLPFVSLYRTVLLHTGLYKNLDKNRWGYAPSNEIQELGLQKAWNKFFEFFTIPGNPKKPGDLFLELTKPPIGLRAGVIPILFAAALKAFPSAISITFKGEYLADIWPSDIEQLCKNPDHYNIVVLDLNKNKREYLREFHKLFSVVSNYEVPSNELIRLCFDALEAWKTQLPPAALTTEAVSGKTKQFQKLLNQQTDPISFLLEGIPRIFSLTLSDKELLLNAIKGSKKELQDVVLHFKKSASDSLQRVLGFVGTKEKGSRVLAKEWASCFPQEFIDELNDRVAKTLLLRMTMDYESDDAFLESLSFLLEGKSFTRWEDSTATKFDRELTEIVHRVEEAALLSESTFKKNTMAVKGLEKLISGRITELVNRLRMLSDEDRVISILENTKNRSLTKK